MISAASDPINAIGTFLMYVAIGAWGVALGFSHLPDGTRIPVGQLRAVWADGHLFSATGPASRWLLLAAVGTVVVSLILMLYRAPLPSPGGDT